MRQTIIQLAPRRQTGQHPGLMLQRYLAKPVTGNDGDPTERRSLLDAAIQAARSEALQAIYAAAYTRWNDSFHQDGLNLAMELRTVGRLIVGLGSENVLETGIRLHHTYGVPIIPGSALKGLTSHYCHEVWGQRHVQSPDESNRCFRRGEEFHRLLFGTANDGGDGGVITFYDAWITPDSLRDNSLRLDVMTPHHPWWQTNDAPPTDFDSPVPVSFLSATGMFQMRLSWSGPVDTPPEKARSWTCLAMALLQEALAEWGVGGKTSSGYGRLVPPNTIFPASLPPPPIKAKPPTLPRPGSRVEAVLLEERTKKGGWKAKHDQSGLCGPIQNSGNVPSDKRPGDSLTLTIVSASEREIAFRYSAGGAEDRAWSSKSRPQGGSGCRLPQGRR